MKKLLPRRRKERKRTSFSCHHTIVHHESCGNEYLLGQKKSASVPTWALLASHVPWTTLKWSECVGLTFLEYLMNAEHHALLVMPSLCSPPPHPHLSAISNLSFILRRFSFQYFHVHYHGNDIIILAFLNPAEFFFIFPFSHVSKRRIKGWGRGNSSLLKGEGKSKHAAPYEKESPVPVSPIPWLGMTAE